MPENHIYNEHDLLLRVAEGDENAFQTLHHHYWNDVYSLAIAFLKSAEGAEDIVQEVFIKLWIRRDTLPAVENFRSFLLVSARNALISSLRKLDKLRRDESAFLKSVELATDIKSNVEANETVALVRQALAGLSVQQQTIFMMSREEHLDHATIAERLGLSKKTVSNTITIVLGHIRSYLSKKGNLFFSIFVMVMSKK